MFGPSVIGIDMGTVNTLVYAKDRGCLAGGSSVVAMDARSRKWLAFGDTAKQMLGKTPEEIVAVRPIREGAISDFHSASALLNNFLKEAKPKIKTFGPSKLQVVVCVPSDLTGVQKKAIEDAAVMSGVVHVRKIESVLAAAIGADLPVREAGGLAILDIGGGTAEAAVISLGGIVASRSVKSAGDAMNASIQSLLKRRHRLIVGENTAERVKMQLGSAVRRLPAVTMRVAGQDTVTGLPKWVDVSSDDIYEALQEIFAPITDALTRTLESCPPEVASDVVRSGVLLTGGGALLSGMDSLIAKATGLPVHIAPAPLESAAIGASKAADELRLFAKAADTRTRAVRKVGS